jgi:hypothetical protein
MSHPLDDAVRDLIAASDPDAAAILDRERARQESTIELIASENHASPAVMHAAGTCFTNKYAEGYPGRRYYGGCAHMDEDRDPRPGAGQAALRLRVRQRPAALRRPGQHRRLHGPDAAGRYLRQPHCSRTAGTSATA